MKSVGHKVTLRLVIKCRRLSEESIVILPFSSGLLRDAIRAGFSCERALRCGNGLGCTLVPNFEIRDSSPFGPINKW